MKQKRTIISCLVLCTASLAFAQDGATLDELLDLEPAKPSDREEAKPQGNELEGLRETLTAKPLGDVLQQAVAEMDDVSHRLGRDFDSGIETQRQIESILSKLDQVIEQAKQQQSGSSGSGSSGGQPGNADNTAGEISPQGQPGGEPASGQPGGTQASTGDASPGSVNEQTLESRPLESLRKEWGDLPPRLRDQLREGLQEKFSPVYQRLTEAYYQRLAEEQ